MTLMFGFVTWVVLSPLLGVSPRPLQRAEVGEELASTRELAWACAFFFPIFLGFLRATVIVMFGVVTGRPMRASLVPWWCAWLFVAGTFAVGVVALVAGVRNGNWGALLMAPLMFLLGARTAALVLPLRRLQAQRASKRS